MVCRTSDDLGHIHGTLTLLILEDQPERTAPLTRVSERPQQIVKEPLVNIDSAAAKGRLLSLQPSGSAQANLLSMRNEALAFVHFPV